MDVDLDGYEDLLVTNGRLHDVNDRDAVARFSHLPKAKREKVGSLYFAVCDCQCGLSQPG